MATCDDIQETLFLGGNLDEASAAHLRRCSRCQKEAPITRTLTKALAGRAVPDPPPGLTVQVLEATGPLLAERARTQRQASRRHLAQVILIALLPLPAILVVDAYVVWTAYVILSTVLPTALSAYVVFNYAAVVVLLTALTYGAVPLFAERQVRLRQKTRFA